MRVAALAGGTGGAKLLVGLSSALGGDAVTAIVNTGDDDVIYDVHVSPDVDMVTYWLAGMLDTDRGWGIKGDTFHLVEQLGRYGTETWFALGDRDYATCAYRTRRSREGATLSVVTDEIRRSLGVTVTILPMSDDSVRTRIETTDGRTLAFQEYFVKERQNPAVAGVSFDGIDDAKPAPGVIEAIDGADRVIVCPSNPIVSIGPILGLHGVRDALRSHANVIAVSPLIGGRALKGPADKMMAGMGRSSSAAGVAELYADFCDTFVIDAAEDDTEVERIEALGVRAVRLDTIMTDDAASERVARELMDL